MTFYGGLFIGIMIGCIISVIVMCMAFISKGTDEIIEDLCGALQEWVDINEVTWNAPDFGKKRFNRSVEVLNRARGFVND